MGPEIIAALVAAGASLVVSVIGIITARSAQNTVAEIQELAKQSEQIRIKATLAGELLLEEFANIIVLSEGLVTYLSITKKKSLSLEEIKERFVPIGKALAKIRHLMYSTAIYTTPEIRREVEAFLSPITGKMMDYEQWPAFVSLLREHHSKLADYFRNTYLPSGLVR